MKTTLITDRCYACEYGEYCERSYCCLRNSRFKKERRRGMTDKEKKNKIADILLEFYEEYQGNIPNRPMIPSIYASKIIDSLQEEPVSKQKHSNVERTVKDWKEEPKKPISIAEKMYRELPVTIKGSIGWYDGFYLDYDGKELHQAIDKMMLNTGDKIEIMISKRDEQQTL